MVRKELLDAPKAALISAVCCDRRVAMHKIRVDEAEPLEIPYRN